jgi:uncharacterized protein YjbJ (UPF0337 family)
MAAAPPAEHTSLAIHFRFALLEAPMKNSTKDQAEGAMHEVKGKVKEQFGKATNNPRLQNEGADEKVGGKVQKKVGQVEKVLED